MRTTLDATPLLGLRTGVGAFTAGALGALATHSDLEVSAYALSWRGRNDLAALLPDGVRAVTGPMPARALRAAWTRADRPRIEAWTGPVDVVHGTNFVVPPTRAAALVTVHDMATVRHPEMCDAATLAFPALIRRALRRGAWVHAVSAFTAGEVVDCLGADPDRVVVVSPGIPPLTGGSAEGGRRLAGAERYVLAVGTLEPRKDHAGLVRAFDLLAGERRDMRLVLAGGRGWGGASDAVDAAMAGARHAERVVLAGFVTAGQRADLMRGAALLAFPSRYEGFGMPPLEAMAAGVPVVASDAGSLPEVLGDAALMVPVGDTAALAAAMARVLDDDAERHRLIAAGMQRAARFSWERCGDGLVSLYRRLCEGGPACGR